MSRTIIVLLLLALLLSVLVIWLRPAPEVPAGYSLLPTNVDTRTTSPASSDRLEVQTQSGTVEINDVRLQSLTEQVGEHDYALYGLDLEQRYPYAVNFNERGGSLAIAILEEPLAATRQAVEASLLERLDVSRSELCQLTVLVGVPVSINQFYSGINLGLSFCPGAVPLE